MIISNGKKTVPKIGKPEIATKYSGKKKKEKEKKN